MGKITKLFPLWKNNVLEIQTGLFDFSKNFTLFSMEINKCSQAHYTGSYFGIIFFNAHFIIQCYDKTKYLVEDKI